MSRYVKLPNKEPGIFKDTLTGSYYAVKYFEGKKFTKTFEKVDQARKWRSANDKTFTPEIKYSGDLNGVKDFTFKQAWDKYKKIEYPKLEQTTIEVKEERSKFFNELLDVKMFRIDPDFIDDYIIRKKEAIMKTMKANRYNLKSELIELSAVFNFYHAVVDFKFTNPVIKARHFPLGVIKELPERNKKMEPHEINAFFRAMHEISELDGVFADLAETQFYFAGRIGEAAGIRKVSVDLRERILTIDKAIAWHTKTKKFMKLKGTKTGKPRFPHINDRMVEIFRRRLKKMVDDCPYIFHFEGRPLHYYEIHHAYRRGLKKANLHGKYSATHIMRHSMAKQARIAIGSLDGAQAMGGWASQKQVEHYSDGPSHLQIEASQKVEARLKLVN